jgi:hypothetical protein
LLRNQGMRARYQYEVAGHNYRMTELQAAIGIPQLERIAELVDREAEQEGRFGIAEGAPPPPVPGQAPPRREQLAKRRATPER